MTWIDWLPLASFAVLLALAEILSVVTDPGTRARRALYRLGGTTLTAFGEMEKRDIRIRPVVIATEETGGARDLVRRNNVLFWGLIILITTLGAIFVWPWWVPSLVIGLVVAVQTLDPTVMLGLRRVETTATKQRKVGKGVLRVFAVLLVVGGFQLLGWGLTPFIPTGGTWPRVISALAAIGVLYAAIGLIRLAARVGSVVDLPARFGEDASHDDILLLRSFKDDEMTIRAIDTVIGRLTLLLGNRVRFEEYVANLLGGSQRLIAIGKPGEPLPALGAVRTYFSDDEWQNAIDATVRRAGAIIMVAAGTGGFEWELGLLKRTGNLQKTIILIPPIGIDAGIERMQDLFVRLGLHTLDGFSNEDFDNWGFVFLLSVTGIGFTPAGRPVFYLGMGRDWAAYAATLVYGLGILSGRLDPPKHGEFANGSGFAVVVVEQ